MKAILILLLFLFNVSLSFAQTPVVKWSYDIKSFSAGIAAASDIDGDGNFEIVFGCYRNDGGVYALNSEDGTLLWSFYPHSPPNQGCNDVAPLIYDIDGDGMPEVIIASSCTGVTTCLDGPTGVIKWQVPTRGSDSPPTIADLNNDGRLQILHGEFLGWVRCLDAATGDFLWEIQVHDSSWIQTAPTIVDLNSDGILDFVVATWAFNYKDSLYAFDGKTRERLWVIPMNDHVYHGTTVVDFDNDGAPELLVGTWGNKVYCLNGRDGSVVWTYDCPGSVYGPIVAGDIDNDGKCDVVFASQNKVIVLTDVGNLKWEYVFPRPSWSFRGAALADINDDEYLDVLFGTDAGDFIGLNGKDGSELFVMDLAADYGKSPFELDHAPLIADFDGDGNLDAFLVGGWGVAYPSIENNYGRAYLIGLGKGKGPDWLMFQRDVRRQSSMCYDYSSSTTVFKRESTESFALKPNPAKDYVDISLPINSRGFSLQGLKIVDVLGVDCPVSVKYTSDDGSVRLDVSNLVSGIYFISIGNQIRKFIKL